MIRLEDFAGRWRLVKEITDRKAGVAGRFEGGATFTPDRGGLAYLEEGLLQLGDGVPLAGSRRYLWRGAEDGAEVLFEDGRPFHVLRFAPQWEAEHQCAPDHYRVRYDFRAWPRWTAGWTVSGPRKDYAFEARYSREAP